MLNNSKWIVHPCDVQFDCALFKKEFSLFKAVKRATARMSAIGCYYATLNGVRIGNFIMAPGCTSRKRVQVQEYDVTDMLKNDNTLEVELSGGWFKGRMNYRTGDKVKSFIAELEIEYEDGTGEVIVTDESWDAGKSATSFVDIYDGEVTDANYKSEFSKAVTRENSDVCLVAQEGAYVVEQESISPVSIFKTPKGETVIDFGQNLTGYFEFTVDARVGDRVSFSFAEVLDKEGNFYTENYRSAKAQFEYICRDGVQTYKPKLTFWGYRYIRVNEFPSEITPDAIRAIVVHSDMPRTGYLESSDPLLNKLFANIVWGQKGNFLDIPTDCPQRDERQGWTGDAQIFVKTASYNFDVEKFFGKWLEDMRLDQFEDGGIPRIIPLMWGDEKPSAAWADAVTICPWQMYLTYGNRDILEKMYPSMCKYLDYIANSSRDEYLWTGCEHFGDWLGLDAPAGSYKGSSDEDFIASVFYAHSTSLVIKTGRVLGRDVAKYEDLYERIVSKTRETFKEYKTQTECALALYFNIAEDKAAVASQLAGMIEKNGKALQTGFVGTPYLLHALSQNGYSELAYDLLLREKFPSWLYSVKCGATTIWEHWDGRNEDGDFWSSDMNSFNHYAYGSVADWVYGVACGIQTVEEHPAFEEIVIAPVPTDKIDRLSASIKTRHGLVRSSWYHENGKVKYEITTPSNARIIIDGMEYKVEKGTYTF